MRGSVTLTLVKADPQPKQQRSRARRAAMIDHGVQLLKTRDIDDVSVSEITGALGYSTGSFYSAFADKAAFFVAVQRDVNERMIHRIETEIEVPKVARLAMTDRISLCIDFTLSYFREYSGVIRSALRYEAKLPEAWAPNRASAQRITAAMISNLSDADAQRMQVAIQLAFGTMVNAVLHDPGPLRLNDPNFGQQLKRALHPYLGEGEK